MGELYNSGYSPTEVNSENTPSPFYNPDPSPFPSHDEVSPTMAYDDMNEEDLATVPYETMGIIPASESGPPDDPGGSGSQLPVQIHEPILPIAEESLSPSTLPWDEEALLDEETDEEDRLEDDDKLRILTRHFWLQSHFCHRR